MATTPAFSTTNVAGLRSAVSLPAATAVAAWSFAARRKRSNSSFSRRNARMTRTPESDSRVMRLTRSRRVCICWKNGTARDITNQNTSAMSGVHRRKMQPRRTSIRSAATMEPTARSGQRMSWRMPRAIATCTWFTSFVMRVVSEGVPKRSTSSAESSIVLRKSASRRSVPTPCDTRAAIRWHTSVKQ